MNYIIHSEGRGVKAKYDDYITEGIGVSKLPKMDNVILE